MKTTQTQKKWAKIVKEILSWVAPAFCALLATLLLTQYIIINAQVPTPSMLPTIAPGDRVIGLRTAYWFAAPARGDVIVFRFPDNEAEFYVKRVIGLPGETVEIIDGQVFINGSNTPLNEPYLAEAPNKGQPLIFKVPQNCYFVLGDNRNFSSDSRFWQNTYVQRQQIIGVAWFRIFPGVKFIK